MESRVYAEDPSKYLPCIGRLDRYNEPPNENGQVRCDSGIVEGPKVSDQRYFLAKLQGSEISVYYDPMICKLSTHGQNRQEALELMKSALDRYVIRGVTHNIPLLREVVSTERFEKGQISTKFLGEEYPNGFQGHVLSALEKEQLLAVSGALDYALSMRHSSPSDSAMVDGRRRYVQIGSEKESHLILVSCKGNGDHMVELPSTGASKMNCFKLHLEWPLFSPLIKARISHSDSQTPVSLVLQFHSMTTFGFRLIFLGSKYDLSVLTEKHFRLSKFMKEKESTIDPAKVVLSPMPGTIVKVMVKEGDSVREGSELIVVEAMKMQNVLKAFKGGVVAKVHVKHGQTVAGDEILLEIK